MKKWSFIALLLVGSTILGATVLREPIASAAQSVSATIVGPLDAQGNVAVHEQGTAAMRAANDEVGVSQRLSGSVGPPGVCEASGNLYTVPAGHELVALFVSARAIGPGGTSTSGQVDTGGVTVELPLPFSPEALVVNDVEESAASEAVHYVFPGGTTLEFSGVVDGGAVACTFNVSVGGYLQPSS